MAGPPHAVRVLGRWSVAVSACLAVFAGSWWAWVILRLPPAGADQLGVALAVAAAVSAALGGPLFWWAGRATPDEQPSDSVRRPRTLPADVSWFTGRKPELRALRRALSSGKPAEGAVLIVTIDGMPGVGKTAFAVHAAHKLARRFPDGQLFVHLRGHVPGQLPVEPADALTALLLASGVPPRKIPSELEERQALWRDRMAGRRALILLDDATGSEQVRPLLPSAARSLVLVTSRHRLAALPEASSVTLNVMEAGEAAELLVRISDRIDMLPADQSVARLIKLCGYLPLAVSLVAGQLKHRPSWTADHLALELESTGDRLAEIHAENSSVEASFNLFYRHLADNQQQFFRRLGLHPGTDIDSYAAAALNGTNLITTRRLLDDLFGYHLIQEQALGRYALHDLISRYARREADMDPAAQREAAIDRVLDYYLHAARAADHYLARRISAGAPGAIGRPPSSIRPVRTEEDATAWMEAERGNLQAVIDYAGLHDQPRLVIALADALNGFLRTAGYWNQALAVHQVAVEAARRVSDPLAEASALADLGGMQVLTASYPAAAANLNRALHLYQDQSDQLGEANALTEIGALHFMADDTSLAVESLNRAIDLHCGLRNRLGQAHALNYLAGAQRELADYSGAAASLAQALQLYRDLGNRHGEANVLNYLGVLQRVMADYEAAATSLSQSIQLHQDLGNPHGEANALGELAVVQYMTGDLPGAIASLHQTFKLYREIGDRFGETNTLKSLGVAQYLGRNYKAARASLNQAP